MRERARACAYGHTSSVSKTVRAGAIGGREQREGSAGAAYGRARARWIATRAKVGRTSTLDVGREQGCAHDMGIGSLMDRAHIVTFEPGMVELRAQMRKGTGGKDSGWRAG